MIRKIFEARELVNQMQLHPGKCLIRQIYYHSLQTRPPVPWKCLVFQNAARPKAIFITWLHFMGKLLITDRLEKWGIEVEPKCCLCQTYDESREHLFVQCDYSRALWNKVLQSMRMQPYPPANWEQHQQWLINMTKGRSMKTQAIKMLCTEVIHAIWTERNMRIFEKQSRSWDRIAKEIVYVVCVRAFPRFQHLFHNLIF
ncbi:uncharacterized protein LOC132624590 [Lycium barbarum]|uniref:uncharacterized protein LOC132624590 n=1 Tax=Lycium barbarum TaxID=112863 RepID=UPI00293F1880|nr:uncharacterized protein LOC132624590 [Lycium barbarum]